MLVGNCSAAVGLRQGGPEGSTCGLNPLAELVDDGSKCQEAFVYGCPLFHSYSLCPCLGNTLGPGKVHQCQA